MLSSEETVIRWDALSSERVRTLTHKSDVRKVVFSPDGNILATADSSGIGRLWSVKTGTEVRKSEVGRVAFWGGSLAFRKDGKILAIASALRVAL